MLAHDGRGRALHAGLIFEIATAGGVEVKGDRSKVAIRCPIHEDRHASAVLFRDKNVFYCSCCTPDGGWSAKRLAAELGVPWPYGPGSPSVRPRVIRRVDPKPPVFGPAEAECVWNAARRRALDEVHLDEDRAAYEFIRRRRLERAWRAGLLGFLGPDNALKYNATKWFDLGVRLVAPLFDAHGKIQNIQGRNVLNREARLRFPTGSGVTGGVFANAAGLAVLRGEPRDDHRVVLAEGMTDFLALATVPGLTVLSAPGAGTACSAVGSWVRGMDLVLALDRDQAGTNGRLAAAREARRRGADRVRWIEWPSGCKDACQLLDRVGVDGLDLFLAEHLGGGTHG